MKKRASQLLNTTVDFITNMMREQKERQLLQKELFQKKQQEKQAYQVMLNLRYELFECFKEKSYANVLNISNPAQIRIHNYAQTNHGIEFYFRLSKKTSEPIARILLSEMKENMNRDIKSTTSDIINCFGSEYLICVFPYLTKGIYVMGVSDTGTSDIIISVQVYGM